MKFAHYSEQLFTEHLDLFEIDWVYEPRSFPLKWGSGAIKMMFTPDFSVFLFSQQAYKKNQKKICSLRSV